jgi:hypothetical protein
MLEDSGKNAQDFQLFDRLSVVSVVTTKMGDASFQAAAK